jgi:hypothetical protein
MKIIIEKGDSTEQVMMAEALLANGLARAVERAEVKVGVVSKSNEEIARAVLEAVRLFGVGAQWTAVYRVLVDYCGWDSDVAAFCRRMNLIINGAKLDYACNYQAIQKPLAANAILRKEFAHSRRYHAPTGDTVFPRQMFIAEKLLKLLSIQP